MADVELVIRIPEIEYKHIINKEKFHALEKNKQEQLINKILNYVISGTPLPKHGDLIDRGKLKTHFVGTDQGTDLEVYLEPTIMSAKAILKADKEGDE